jgi:hypothetical protein
LGQHPEIYTTKVKETRFFSWNYEKGMEFYEQYFQEASTEKAVGETTPSYSFLPFVADRIKKHFPYIKLILCFRNPVDRVFSSWLMQSSMGTEKLSLREAIDINLKQLSYVTLEGEKGEKTWAESRGNFSADESRLRTYIQGSYYSKILESYLERFPKAQIKVIFLEDIKNDFDQTMSSLFSFLEVDPTFVIPSKEIVNFHFDRKANKITNKLFGVNGTRFLISITPKFLKRKMKSAWRTKETLKLNHEDRLYLWSIFKEDVARLEKLVDRDLSHWTPPIKEVRALA